MHFDRYAAGLRRQVENLALRHNVHLHVAGRQVVGHEAVVAPCVIEAVDRHLKEGGAARLQAVQRVLQDVGDNRRRVVLQHDDRME